jgi:peptidoglycan/LPS O-acetylase OafA/YrhL
MVVAFHAKLSFMQGGFVGVDVFFVISGYLITGLLVKEYERYGTVDLVRFYARRARRLLPAAALVIAVTLGAGNLVLSPGEQANYTKTALSTAAYSSNVWFILSKGTSNYFAPEAELNPYLHTWSLAVEEQFYFVWPILILAGLRQFRSRKRLSGFLAVVSLVSLAACLWLTRHHQSWAFFASPARAWEFGLGGIASLLPLALLAKRPAWSVLSWVGLGGLIVTGVLSSSDRAFPGVRALVPVMGTALLLLAGAVEPSCGAGPILISRPMRWLGRLSYSWYLWHWPVLLYTREFFPGISIYGNLLAAAVSLLLADLTYRLVEDPIRAHPRLLSRPVLSLALAGTLTVSLAALCLLNYKFSLHQLRMPRQREIQAAISEDFPLQREGCISNFGDARVIQCVLGDPSGTPVALFGDSHMAHWVPAFEEIARARKWKLVTFVKSGCPATDIRAYEPRMGHVEAECSPWRTSAIARIVELHPSLLIISDSDRYFEETIRHGGYSEYSAASQSSWREGTRKTVAPFDQAAIPTVVLHDIPRPAVNVPVCLSRAVAHGQPEAGCAPSPATALSPEALQAEQAAVSGMANVRVLDLSTIFCDTSHCKVVEDGIPVYRDSNHLATAYVRKLAPVLSADLPLP